MRRSLLLCSAGGGGGTSAGGQVMPGLQHVKHIIGVASCKGGVGKSTVAANLACSLSATGAKTGLFDADVFGPSLPTLFGFDRPEVLKTPKGLLTAPTYNGISCMSFDFVSPPASEQPAGAAIRGPMVSRIVQQLIGTTEWGALDYLVVDMPPGTGDIVLTLGQQVPFDAAVHVTTPHQLSFVDVVKGLNMFETLKIPSVGVVENMAHFTCDHGSQYRLFGKGHLPQLVGTYGIPVSAELPLDPAVSADDTVGTPAVVKFPDSAYASTMKTLASQVIEEVARLKAAPPPPDVSFDPRRNAIVIRTIDDKGASEVLLPPLLMRMHCKCAVCVDEVTGEQRLRPGDVDPTVIPFKMRAQGNYAVAVRWSDGHDSSIYTHTQLRELAEQFPSSA